MNNRRFFLGVLVCAAAFIYLVGVFLTATFNIGLWSPGQRLFAVIVYLFIVWGAVQALVEPSKNSGSKQKEKVETEDKVEAV